MLTDKQDAFGHALMDALTRTDISAVVERDDGYVDVMTGVHHYFGGYGKWLKLEKQAARFVRGKVLDIGCGGGRALLHFREKGLDITGIDNSPLAVKICRKRGARKVRLLSIENLPGGLGQFDSVVMFGANFGLMGNPRKARVILKRLHKMISDEGRIVAIAMNPYRTKQKEHLDYQRANRHRGNLAGQIKIRIRYRHYCTPYFEWLLVSPGEMADILMGTGWGIKKIIPEDKIGLYGALLGKC